MGIFISKTIRIYIIQDQIKEVSTFQDTEYECILNGL